MQVPVYGTEVAIEDQLKRGRLIQRSSQAVRIRRSRVHTLTVPEVHTRVSATNVPSPVDHAPDAATTCEFPRAGLRRLPVSGWVAPSPSRGARASGPAPEAVRSQHWRPRRVNQWSTSMLASSGLDLCAATDSSHLWRQLARLLVLSLHGKEGVDGSSPSEGFAKSPANGHVVLPASAKIRRAAGTKRVHFGTDGHSRARATSRDTSGACSRQSIAATHSKNSCKYVVVVARAGARLTPSIAREGFIGFSSTSWEAQQGDAGVAGSADIAPVGRFVGTKVSTKSRAGSACAPSRRPPAAQVDVIAR